jgi:hypothetical protein
MFRRMIEMLVEVAREQFPTEPSRTPLNPSPGSPPSPLHWRGESPRARGDWSNSLEVTAHNDPLALRVGPGAGYRVPSGCGVATVGVRVAGG